MIRIPRFKSLVAAACATFAVLAAPASAQNAAWPARPIELVVPFGVGGGTDVLARVFAEAARKHLSQPITVMNRPGASGAIGLGEVARSAPDGYKLALMTVEMVILPHIGLGKYQTTDFVPIVRLNEDPVVLTVSADSPWRSIEDFLNATRKSKDGMRMGNAGTGGLSHLAALGLQQKLSASMIHVPFQGNAPAVVALLGGHIDAVTASPAEVWPHVTAGKLRALAVFGDQRLKGLEQVPTLKERNVDLAMFTWRGVGAPKGLPADVQARLSDAAMKIAAEPMVKEAMEKMVLGYSVADGAKWGAQITRDSNYFKALVTQLNLKVE